MRLRETDEQPAGEVGCHQRIPDQFGGSELSSLLRVRGVEHVTEQRLERTGVGGRRALDEHSESSAQAHEVRHAIGLGGEHADRPHPGL